MLEAPASWAPVDPLDVVLADRRTRRGRPWVMLNMVSSIDGAAAVGERSAGLGDDDDHVMLRAIRAVPDVIVVGAATVAAEDYRPVSLDDERRERRVALGKAPAPTLAIVSGSLSVDPAARVFSDPEHKPLIITGAGADPSKLAMLGDSADLAFLDDLGPRAILGHLGAASVALLEGGPALNGQFADAGLLDEINLTVASKVVAGEAGRIVSGPALAPPAGFVPERVLRGDRDLFVRYLRADP